jgi:hypothetical protein
MNSSTNTQNKVQGFTIWKDRWDALDKTLETLGEYYGPYGPVTFPDFSRRTTLYRLVMCLRSFAGDQFNYFYERFGGDDTPRRLGESTEFPDEFVLQAVLAQVGYDVEAILRAAHQRISGSPRMRQALETADKLAWQALQLAKDRGFIEEKTTALTYFQKSPNARIIPYAPVALIGVPFTAMSATRDYLAIAHEVGHYVYWRGRTKTSNEEPVYRNLARSIIRKGVKDEVRNWQEEIFADVYGCLVAGPPIALSAQELAFQASVKDFVKDDKEHPKPVVRPDIYAEILKEPESGECRSLWKVMRDRKLDMLEEHRKRLSDKDQDLATQLESLLTETQTLEPAAVILPEQSEDALADRRKLATQRDEILDRYAEIRAAQRRIENDRQGYPERGDVNLPEMQEEMDKVVTEVKSLLPSSLNGGWVVDGLTNEEKDYYAGFERFVGQTQGKDLHLGEIEPCPTDVWQEWKVREGFSEEQGPDGLVIAGSKEDLEEHVAPNGTWIQIALAAGWTTEIHNHGNP